MWQLIITLCSVVSDSVTPWTVAHQAPLPMKFPRQEYWSGLPFPTPGDLPSSEIKPTSLVSPVLAAGFFTTLTPGKPVSLCISLYFSLSVTLSLSVLSLCPLRTFFFLFIPFSFFSLFLIIFLSLLEVFALFVCPASPHLVKECLFSG